MLILAALVAVALPAPAPATPTSDARAEILQVLKRLEPQLIACGKKGSGPEEAKLFFTVDTNGVARDVGVDLDDRAAACIIQIVASARFPSVATPQNVEVPVRIVRRPKASGCDSVDPDMRSAPVEQFNPAAVLKRVKRIVPQVRACADAASPSLVKTSWVVDTGGMPVSIVVGDGVDSPLSRCIAAQVATLRFPRPATAMPVSIPFKLR